MFAASDLNSQNNRRQVLIRILFMLMTGLLILPVLIILTTLIYKGGPAISFEFLFANPTNGMTEGGIFPALVGTVWLVAVDVSKFRCVRARLLKSRACKNKITFNSRGSHQCVM